MSHIRKELDKTKICTGTTAEVQENIVDILIALEMDCKGLGIDALCGDDIVVEDPDYSVT